MTQELPHNDADARAQLRRGYVAWKQWSNTVGNPKRAARLASVFSIEVARAALPAGAQILEIGFGDGAFLDWCRASGHAICGVELIPELVNRARERGHDVVLGNGDPPTDFGRHSFDLVAAFDVFEHLSVVELGRWLSWAGGKLTPNGRILARFPNAGSPFGLGYQLGDLTHVTALTVTSIEQLSQPAGLRVVSVHNAARSIGPGHRQLTNRVAYAIRDLVEVVIGHVYFSRRIPLDPNLTVVLGRD